MPPITLHTCTCNPLGYCNKVKRPRSALCLLLPYIHVHVTHWDTVRGQGVHYASYYHSWGDHITAMHGSVLVTLQGYGVIIMYLGHWFFMEW